MDRIVTLEIGQSKLQTNQSLVDNGVLDLNTRFNMNLEMQSVKKNTEEGKLKMTMSVPFWLEASTASKTTIRRLDLNLPS